MFGSIKTYCNSLTGDFLSIPQERRKLLERIAAYISTKRAEKKKVDLVYICTHNSRRSHFGQVWAGVAASFYGLSGVASYSGGTEATAFNENAIRALRSIGFDIRAVSAGANPRYHVRFDDKEPPVECFSKEYSHPVNPSGGFAAIMTCGEAEENCPFISGAELRIATTYEDPKAADHSPHQDETYLARCRQIALETFYVFSLVK